MDDGKTYRVWYQDGERIREKTLIFLQETKGLIEFQNNRKEGRKEWIPVARIVRMEEMDDGQQNTLDG